MLTMVMVKSYRSEAGPGAGWGPSFSKLGVDEWVPAFAGNLN
jgi:hypothetical protein